MCRRCSAGRLRRLVSRSPGASRPASTVTSTLSVAPLDLMVRPSTRPRDRQTRRCRRRTSLSPSKRVSTTATQAGTADDQAVLNGTGTVVYCNQAHGFRINIANPTVVIDGASSRIIADVNTNISGDLTPSQRVHLADLDVPSVTIDEQRASAEVTWPAISSDAFANDGSDALRLCEVSVPGAPPGCLYPPGTTLDALTVTANFAEGLGASGWTDPQPQPFERRGWWPSVAGLTLAAHCWCWSWCHLWTASATPVTSTSALEPCPKPPAAKRFEGEGTVGPVRRRPERCCALPGSGSSLISPGQRLHRSPDLPGQERRLGRRAVAGLALGRRLPARQPARRAGCANLANETGCW